VAEADLLESPDREIWEFAKAQDFVIVSTDSDFYELAPIHLRVLSSTYRWRDPARQRR
jgi:predicted nuclease of predicted toxin-antitoxin system